MKGPWDLSVLFCNFLSIFNYFKFLKVKKKETVQQYTHAQSALRLVNVKDMRKFLDQ